jgi:hypothetical protein
MDPLLSRCPACHTLMVRSPERRVCKRCHDQQRLVATSELEELEPSPVVSEQAAVSTDVDEVEAETERSDEAVPCRQCGEPVDAVGPYCVRCRLQIAGMTRKAVSKMTANLQRMPSLRGSGRSMKNGSRSHVLDIIKRPRSRSYTPGTKYSG